MEIVYFTIQNRINNNMELKYIKKKNKMYNYYNLKYRMNILVKFLIIEYLIKKKKRIFVHDL